MALSSNQYALKVQRLEKIYAQTAVPKVPEWPSYGNFCNVTQQPHFLKKSAKGRSREIFKKSPKKQPSKILGEAGKQEILQQMFRKFQFSNGLPNRYFTENCRWVPPKALWRKWHYPLISMHFKCKDWRRFRRKQRFQKCPNGQVMQIFARSPKTCIFRKRAKGRPREVFQKSPRKQPSLQWANSTLAQMSLPTKLNPLIIQRLKKILAQKAAPKLPEWPSYGNFRKVTQNPHFLKKCKKSPKKQPSFGRPTSTLAQMALPSNQYALKLQRLEKI